MSVDLVPDNAKLPFQVNWWAFLLTLYLIIVVSHQFHNMFLSLLSDKNITIAFKNKNPRHSIIVRWSRKEDIVQEATLHSLQACICAQFICHYLAVRVAKFESTINVYFD